jgi:class 3 adenylate cyclase
MVIYRSVDDAVRSAIAMQQCCHHHSKDLPPEDKVLLCIGIGYGDMLRIGDQDVFGEEVNAACKLGEDTAKAHEILITSAVADAVKLPKGAQVEVYTGAPEAVGPAFRLNYDNVVLKSYASVT